MNKQQKPLTFELAFAELNSILDAVQKQEIHLESLTEQLRRAKELIAFCQQQLQLTESELASLFSDEEE
jgi:exodeoxyribonuclease VII small subunit